MSHSLKRAVQAAALLAAGAAATIAGSGAAHAVDLPSADQSPLGGLPLPSGAVPDLGESGREVVALAAGGPTESASGLTGALPLGATGLPVPAVDGSPLSPAGGLPVNTEGALPANPVAEVSAADQSGVPGPELSGIAADSVPRHLDTAVRPMGGALPTSRTGGSPLDTLPMNPGGLTGGLTGITGGVLPV